jgi:hypothetical protein
MCILQPLAQAIAYPMHQGDPFSQIAAAIIANPVVPALTLQATSPRVTENSGCVLVLDTHAALQFEQVVYFESLGSGACFPYR